MTDYPYGKRMAELTDWAQMHSPERPLAATNYAYAVAKGQSSWLATVDQFLVEMKQQQKLQAYAAKHGLDEIVYLPSE